MAARDNRVLMSLRECRTRPAESATAVTPPTFSASHHSANHQGLRRSAVNGVSVYGSTILPCLTVYDRDASSTKVWTAPEAGFAADLGHYHA